MGIIISWCFMYFCERAEGSLILPVKLESVAIAFLSRFNHTKTNQSNRKVRDSKQGKVTLLRCQWERSCWRFFFFFFCSGRFLISICSKFYLRQTSTFPWVAPEVITVARFSEVTGGVIAIPQASLVPSQQQNMLSWQPVGLLLLMLIKTYPCMWVCVYIYACVVKVKVFHSSPARQSLQRAVPADDLPADLKRLMSSIMLD